MASSAIFLDRDGTLIEDRDYLSKPEEVRFFPGVIESLKRAVDAGFILVMVTNQSGVGRGYFTMEDVEKVHEFICQQLSQSQVGFAKIYVAPEAPDQPSRGRKPSPAFLLDAQEELKLDLSRSYMIGDKLLDLQCGWNAGVRHSILVRTGYGGKVEKKQSSELGDALVVDDMPAAIEWIINDLNGGR